MTAGVTHGAAISSDERICDPVLHAISLLSGCGDDIATVRQIARTLRRQLDATTPPRLTHPVPMIRIVDNALRDIVLIQVASEHWGEHYILRDTQHDFACNRAADFNLQLDREQLAALEKAIGQMLRPDDFPEAPRPRVARKAAA
jgi:hypothetical protein